MLRHLAALALVCGLAAPAFAAINRTPLQEHRVTGAHLAARLLSVHNRERQRLRVRPLAWDPRLAAAAAAYGRVLAAKGRLEHSPPHRRPGQLENLWMGTRGAFSPEEMVGNWISERSRYRRGIFPAVSLTGRWTDVAHYTQLIWPGTTHVGCAVQQASRWEYLICRYSPPGNVVGSRTP